MADEKRKDNKEDKQKSEKKKHKKRKRSLESSDDIPPVEKRREVNPAVAPPSSMGSIRTPIVSSDAKVLEDETEVVTLEERLKEYSEALLTKEDNIQKKKLELERNAPSSDSLVVLVEQALQSGDDVLLEQCLACDDKDIIDATTSKLPTSKVFLFLRRLVSKFEKRPSRGLLLTRWLSALLKYHSSYLISFPELSSRFAGLSQIMEQRLASYSRLASLGGRLDLLMAHVSSHVDSGGNSKLSNNPRVTFREEKA